MLPLDAHSIWEGLTGCSTSPDTGQQGGGVVYTPPMYLRAVGEDGEGLVLGSRMTFVRFAARIGALVSACAIASVVKIFTRNGAAGFSPSITLGAGTYNSQTLDASLSGGDGQIDYAVGLSRTDALPAFQQIWRRQPAVDTLKALPI